MGSIKRTNFIPDKTGIFVFKKKFWRFISYLVLIIFLVFSTGPYLINILAAFKNNIEISKGLFLLPNSWQWINFQNAWVQGRFSLYFRNSMVVALLVVSVSVILSALAGYAFARVKFRSSRFLFFVFLLGMMVPQESYIINLYYQLRNIGLTDTYWGLVLPQIGMSVCFGIFWMRAAFLDIPDDLEDAAKVDGCTNFDAFWRIMLPLVFPAILTLAVLFFVWTWNDFLLSLVIISSENLRTLPLGLALFQGRYARDIPLTSAGAVIVSLPIILFYLLFQRQFMRGVISGAVKG